MTGADSQGKPDARPHHLGVRLTTAERSQIRKAAARRALPPSAFMRGAGLDAAKLAEGRTPTADEAPPTAVRLSDAEMLALDAARLEVRRAGTNLNQAVRAMNRGQVDLGQLGPVVRELARLCTDLVALLGGRAS